MMSNLASVRRVEAVKPGAGRRRRVNGLAVYALLVLVGWAAVAAFGPLLLTHSADQFVSENGYAPASRAAWLGTDEMGRDMLSRLVYAARPTLLISLLATVLAHLVGDTLGILSALRGGVLDRLLCRIAEILLSMPKIIVGLVVIGALGPSEWLLVAVTGGVYAVTVFRITRGLALDVVRLDYIRAAEIRGERWPWLVFNEVLPNIAPALLADFALRFGLAILFISNLSFLGLGLQPPSADWGMLVRENMDGLASGSFAALYPTLAIASVTISLNFLVDGFRVGGHAREFMK